jgi:hypothetical protein
MPRRQGAVPSTQRQGNKPVAPADLWEKLEAATATVFLRPPNTFTSLEFADRYKITQDTAQKRIRKLRRLKRIEYVGKIGNNSYYGVVEDK